MGTKPAILEIKYLGSTANQLLQRNQTVPMFLQILNFKHKQIKDKNKDLQFKKVLLFSKDRKGNQGKRGVQIFGRII